MSADFQLYHRFRVRYAEVDPQAVVFNSRYLEYADIVLAEFLRSRGLPLLRSDELELQVVHAEIRYVKPLRFDDEVGGWLRVAKVGRSSIAFEIELRLVGQTDAATFITIHQVNVDLASGRSMEISAPLRATLLTPGRVMDEPSG